MLMKVLGVVRDNRGATAIEYGLIASLIALVAVAGMGAVGTKIKGTFSKVSTTLAT